HRICGPAFRRWLRHQYYKLKKRGCNSDALKVAVDTLDAKATFEGETREVHVRIAGHKGNIYIDLGDKSWKAVEVSETGWSVVADPPVRFARPPNIRSLPIPVKGGGSIQLLQPFCNLSSGGFTLFVAVLLAGLRPDSNYPVPVITGEQGCGKSSLVRILARLIDPRMPEQRSMPRSEEDLLVAAKAQHLLSYDNVSRSSRLVVRCHLPTFNRRRCRQAPALYRYRGGVVRRTAACRTQWDRRRRLATRPRRSRNHVEPRAYS